MSPESIQGLFARVFGEPGVATATMPLLTVGVGVMLLLLADIVPALNAARPLIFLGSLAAGAIAELRILFADTPPGLVLDGTFLADPTTAVWGLLFLAATGLAWAYSIGYYRREDSPFKTEHDVLMLAAPVGMMLMVGARDLIAFFVGLELLSIPLYVLAAFRRGRTRSVEAGLKYFLLGAFASGFFLYGAAMIYAGTGTVDLGELRDAGLATPLVLGGVALLTASLFFKVSVFPFHLWVPDVYEGSPTPVTALMATGTKGAAFGFLVPASFLLPPEAAGLVAGVAIVTLALGNLGALVQEDLKRMLAYSGIAHAGTLLLVVAGALASDGLTPDAVRAALFYMAAYVFTAAGAFGLVALLEADGGTRLDDLRGLARSRPRTAAALALFMLSLGGIPATGGFLGKWFVFSVLVRADMIGTAIVGALLSVVALGYYLRVIVVMYMHERPEGAPAPTTLRAGTAGVATAVCAFFVVLLGVAPAWFLGWIA